MWRLARQGHISLPMSQKPAFRLYTLCSFGLSKGAICANWHGSASDHHQTWGDETGNQAKEKTPDPL